MNFECLVAHLRRQAILQVEKTSLTNIFQLTAGLADFSLLETHPCTGAPPKHSEWPRTDLALLAVLFLQHPNIGIVTETSLTKNGKVLQRNMKCNTEICL